MYYNQNGFGMYLSESEEFCLQVADWFIDYKPTIRECADNFMISYGQCWNILRDRIKYIDDDKYKQIENICKHRR